MGLDLYSAAELREDAKRHREESARLHKLAHKLAHESRIAEIDSGSYALLSEYATSLANIEDELRRRDEKAAGSLAP